MRSRPERLFPKPTAIAVMAAVLGVLIHGAVFFLVRIDAESPADPITAQPTLSFLGPSDPATIALIDPLTLLIRSEQAQPRPGLEDFRSLSISREISGFPPFFKLEENREWTAWIPAEVTERNPGAWLLERTESSLRNFGQTALPDLALPSDRMTLRSIDLMSGESRVLTLPLPTGVEASLREATFPNPATFLLDRSDTWSRPPALLVESSGNVAVDRALRQTLSANAASAVEPGDYVMVTYFFPPVNDAPPPQNP